MNLALGIDTGGTYTDAVLVDYDTDQILVSAKALTTRRHLALGIGEAIAAVLAAGESWHGTFESSDIVLVALSTTLATNALAEGHTSAVALLLIGYDPALIQRYGFERELAAGDVVHVGGGHDQFGNEVAPLDEAAARAAILARRDTVEAFAVSGYFGVRNPNHENRVRALVDELTGRPVTCGHELTSQLNAVRRATTVALNAHLILPLRELIQSVQQTLTRCGIAAPLMVVKGDGSLMRADWALHRPIETILSGPAASVVGAWHLSGRRDVWVVDVGGTTTDIGALQDGVPILNRDGASVAGWRTMVEAVDVRTAGLGGDSQVRIDADGEISIGPRRVVPLCLLASQYPAVIADLRFPAARARRGSAVQPAEFLVAGRQSASRLSLDESALIERLTRAPQLVTSLAHQARQGGIYVRDLEDLEERGLVRRAGFTPTDALHVLKRFNRWDHEASLLGASLLASRAGLPVEAFCESVAEGVADRIAGEVLGKVMEGEIGPGVWQQDRAAQALIRRAFSGDGAGDLECRLSLRRPLVAIGAPVGAYMPGVARRLHSELVIPDHSDVANAVGAVAGSVVERCRVVIHPLPEEAGLRVHLPHGTADFAGLEEAVAHAQGVMLPHVEALARSAGAGQLETRVERQDHWAPTPGGDRLYLGSELTFTAVGRPSPARG